MGTVLFNTHDVVLLITAYSCTLFALLLVITQKDGRTAHFLLAAFLLTQASIPISLLINYGTAFRDIALAFSPNLFNLFDLAYWLEGPFLLFYTRSLIYKDYSLKRRDLIYMVPFIAYALHQFFNYFLLPEAVKYEHLANPELFKGPTYIPAITLFREIFRVTLGVMCIYEIYHYRQHLKDQYSSTENIDLSWLRLLTYGFLVMRVWALFVVFALFLERWGVQIDPGNMGLAGNYTTFFLVSVLIFYSLRFSTIIKGIEISPPQNGHSSSPINDEDALTLQEVMLTRKPYLTHSLTLNQLADMVGIAPRALSNLINRHFEKSFFEYINFYRVEESKRLLRAHPADELSVLDAMLDSGFSSKAAFNRFFKKYVGQTPSEFRKLQPSANHHVAKELEESV